MSATEPNGAPGPTSEQATQTAADWEDLRLRLEAALEQNEVLRAELRRVEHELQVAKLIIAGFNAEKFSG